MTTLNKYISFGLATVNRNARPSFYSNSSYMAERDLMTSHINDAFANVHAVAVGGVYVEVIGSARMLETLRGILSSDPDTLGDYILFEVIAESEQDAAQLIADARQSYYTKVRKPLLRLYRPSKVKLARENVGKQTPCP